MKKVIILSAALVLLAGIFAGYLLIFRKPKAPSRVVVARPSYERASLQWMGELIEGFSPQGEEPYGVEVSLPEGEYQPYISQRLGTSASEDLFYSVNSWQLRQWASQGKMEALPREVEDLLSPSFRKFLSDQDHSYYFPLTWYAWGIYYNQELWDSLGLTEPSTWEDFLQVCEILKSQGIAPIVISRSEMWVGSLWLDYISLRSQGPAFHQALLDQQIPWTDPKVLEIFHHLRSLQPYLADIPSQTLWEDGAQDLAQREAGMALMGRFFQQHWQNESYQDTLSWFSFPEMDEAVPKGDLVSSAGLILSQGYFNREETRDFLIYLSSDQAIETIEEGSSSLPAATPQWWQAQQGLDREAWDSLQDSTAFLPVMDRNCHPEMLIPIKLAVRAALFSPQPVEEILEELEERRSRL